MNRLELRKMSLEFRRLSSNLLNSTDDTADINLSRFLKFINGNELILGFIKDKISGIDYDFKKCYAIGCSGGQILIRLKMKRVILRRSMIIFCS